jgi:outer membrane protein OmpU
MKKQLMTTTALIAAGMIAMSGAALGADKKPAPLPKPALKVSGNLSGIVSAASQDTKDYLGVGVFNDAEIHFTGTNTMDNGIKLKAVVEMEGQNGNASHDESSLSISGAFGSINVGANDNAADAMVGGSSGSGATNVGRNTGLHVGSSIIKPSGHTAATANTLDLGDGDSNKISYFTPRVSGIQVGMSFIPTFTETSNKQVKQTGAHHNGVALAANYKGKMGDTAITVAAGYMSAENSTSTSADLSGVAMSVAVTMGKITLAFGMGEEKNITSVAGSGISYADYGIKYVANTKDSFSLGYETVSDASTATAGDDKTTVAMLSYARALGAGVSGNINLVYANYEGEVAGSSDDNDGFGIQTEIKVKF